MSVWIKFTSSAMVCNRIQIGHQEPSDPRNLKSELVLNKSKIVFKGIEGTSVQAYPNERVARHVLDLICQKIATGDLLIDLNQLGATGEVLAYAT